MDDINELLKKLGIKSKDDCKKCLDDLFGKLFNTGGD